MQKYIAEGLGTFFLVFTGCLSIIVNDVFPGVLGTGGIPAVFGIIVMVLIYSVGNISGAHFNPAVTLGFTITGRLPIRQFLPYVLSQISGAVLASVLLKLFFPSHDTLGATLSSVSMPATILFEIIFTALLMFVILNVSTGHMEKGIMAGVAVGGTISLAAMVGGPLTGASLNPARSLGPALLSGHFEGLWIYLTAPFLGVLLASPSCRIIQGEQCCPQETNHCDKSENCSP